MGEKPLRLRREQLSLNYWSNLHQNAHLTLQVLKAGWAKENKNKELWMDNKLQN